MFPDKTTEKFATLIIGTLVYLVAIAIRKPVVPEMAMKEAQALIQASKDAK